MGDLAEPVPAVDAGTPAGRVADLFRENGRDYLPVAEGEERRVLGLCGRGEIGLAAASGAGERPVRDFLLAEPLLLAAGAPLDAVLEATFRRQGPAFHHDVVVVDGLAPEARRLVGLVPLRVLVDFQSRQVGEQVGILARKEEMLRQALTAQFRHSVEMRRVQKRDQQMHDELRQAAQQQFRTSMDLRRSQARYHTLFENSAVGVALLDTAGVSATYNRHFASLLKLPPPLPGAVPPPVDICDFMPMSARAEFLSALMRLEGMPPDAPPASLELPLEIGADGSRGEARFRLTLSWIADAAQVCLCAADVTEERNLQKKILQQEKDVLLESLLGGIAHELNNKALPLLGFGELLAGEAAGQADPAKIAGYTQVLKKSSAEFAAVVHQLLQLVKPSGAKAQSVDLRQVAREVAGLMAFPLRDARITLVEQFPDEAVHVTADEAQVKQIAVNLVLNAIDALHAAFRKELVFRLHSANGQAFFECADSGTGIGADVLPRIFDPFFTTKSAETARGLGLSVSRSLARQNHGEITVESKPGEGSTFTLRLPVALSCPLPAPGAAPSVPAAEVPAPAPAAPARPPAILVVDDEENVGSLVQEVLRRKFKGEVRRAYNGEEGIAQIEERDARGDGPFDLVVSDVRMPVKNGLEMFRWIAEHRPALVPHFFFMTGHDGTNEMSEEIARSDVPVLRKPFAIAALVEMCHKRMAGAVKTG